MIYLILSAEIEIIDEKRGEFKYSPILKIGYTKDIDSRFDTYLLHNPGCKLLGKREGDTELESFFHSYYSEYKYPGRDREWFYYSQDIVDNFQDLQIGDKFLSKEEYIEGLREYLKSNIPTTRELRNNYLENILKELENTKSEVEFNKDFHISYTMNLWEEEYRKEIEYIDSFNFTELLKNFPNQINLRENPWKNQATFYYRSTADYKKMKLEDFQKIVKNKQSITESLLAAYNNLNDDRQRYDLASTYQKMASAFNYKDDYVAVNKVINDRTGELILKPVINELVLVNEIRAFKIQQIDYADRFVVFSTVHNKLTKDDIINQEASKFLEKYISKTTMYDKLRLLCEADLSESVIRIILGQISDSDEIKSYYTSLGPQKLKALGYSVTRIKKALGIIIFSEELLLDSIYSEFKEGEKLPLSVIKGKLSYIYSSINYQLTPKATDIERWFEVKEISLFEKKDDGSRKRIKAYEFLKSKEQELRLELKYSN